MFIFRILLAILGIADATYLLILEQGGANCARFSMGSCWTMLPFYSHHLIIPLPILGMTAFLSIIITLVAAKKYPKIRKFHTAILIVAMLFSWYLLALMIFIIKSVCIFCLVSFIIVLMLNLCELIQYRKILTRKLIVSVVGAVIFVISVVFTVSQFYKPQQHFHDNSAKVLSEIEELSFNYRYQPSENKELLLYVYAKDCVFCEYFASEILGDSNVKKILENYNFYRVKIEDSPMMIKSFESEITSTPAIMVIDNQANRRYIFGIQPIENITKFLDSDVFENSGKIGSKNGK